METPREYYYTYYSYEEWGRGYFGSRGCKCLPEEDMRYFGSFKDKTFKPTQKIILKDDYFTREEAYADEIILQHYYKVVENPHFVNRAYQTSVKFSMPTEQKKIIGKMVYEKLREENRGLHSISKEDRRKFAMKGVETNRKLHLGIYSLTKEQMRENGKKIHEEGKGIFSLTPEDRTENGRKGGTISGNNNKKNKTGFCGRSKEKMREDGRKAGKACYEKKIGIFAKTKEELSAQAAKVNSQKWKCLVTGFITNPGTLSGYQKARGIDTSQRIRLE
jgi:general stress protein YciG